MEKIILFYRDKNNRQNIRLQILTEILVQDTNTEEKQNYSQKAKQSMCNEKISLMFYKIVTVWCKL